MVSFNGRTTQKAAVCHGAVDLRIVSEWVMGDVRSWEGSPWADLETLARTRESESDLRVGS
jgi:hypothetical protein